MPGSDPVLEKLRATPRSGSRHHLGRKQSELRLWVEKNYADIRQLIDVEDRTLGEIASHAADAGYRLANGQKPDSLSLAIILYRVKKARATQPNPQRATARESVPGIPVPSFGYIKKKE